MDNIIIRRFVEEGYNISPEAVKAIKESEGGVEDTIKKTLDALDETTFVIGREHIVISACGKGGKDKITDMESREVGLKEFGLTAQTRQVPEPTPPIPPSIREVEEPPLKLKKAETPPPATEKIQPPQVLEAVSKTCQTSNSTVPQNFQFCKTPEAAPTSNPPSNPPSDIKVLKDITSISTCTGEYDEFVDHFRHRYDKLSAIIRRKINASNISLRSISSINNGGQPPAGPENQGISRRLRNSVPQTYPKTFGFRTVAKSLILQTYPKRSALRTVAESQIPQTQNIAAIGIVSNARETAKGNKLITIEDMSGELLALVSRSNQTAFKASESIMLDEIVGITGTMGNTRGNTRNDSRLFFVNNIILPDIPASHRPGRSNKPVNLLVISDTHVGSDTFMEDAWERLTRWLNQDLGDEAARGLAAGVGYVIVAGDIVDGIGVYPNQERELSIKDIYEQYSRAAELFSQIPRGIKIIISPGNHDAVRQAEPQPALPEEIRSLFKNCNTLFVGNPALIEISGVKTLVYHGRSMEDFVALPHVTYDEPTTFMTEILKCRHISPTYGGRVSIAPESSDHLIIDESEIPDIFITGHGHIVGLSDYRGITLINPGAWQGQTEFQRQRNITPTPGRAVLVNLHTMEKPTVLEFMSS